MLKTYIYQNFHRYRLYFDFFVYSDWPGSVEGHEPVPALLLVVHLVPAGDGDLVHLDGAAGLRGHQDLGRHHLQ